MLPDVREDELAELYAWVDSVPLSKPKKSIARDFADGVCMAEMIHHYFPRMVELHNYSPTCNSAQKVTNWTTLNQKVFKKFGFTLAKEACEQVAFAEPGVIERILKLSRTKLAQYQTRHGIARASHLQTAVTAQCGAYGSPILPSVRTPAAGGQSLQFITPAGTGVQGGDGRSELSNMHMPARGAAFSPEAAYGITHGSSSDENNNNNNKMYKEVGRGVSESPQSDLIASHHGSGNGRGLNRSTAAVAAATAAVQQEEIQELRALNKVLEVKASKMEQLLRLKDAKIAALTARLQSTGIV